MRSVGAAVCSAVYSSCAGCSVVLSFSSCSGVLRGDGVVASVALVPGLGVESRAPVGGGLLTGGGDPPSPQSGFLRFAPPI